MACRGNLVGVTLNGHASTERDVSSWRKHADEMWVQFGHEAFEISGGLSTKHIQDLSIH